MSGVIKTDCRNKRVLRNFSLHLLMVTLLLSFLSACASKVPSDYPADQKYAAAKYAVQQDSRLRTIVEVCRGVNAETSALANETLIAWWDRNWRLVAAADREITYQVLERQRTSGAELGQLDIWSFLQDLENEELRGLRDRVVRTNNRAAACGRRLAPYAEPENDLFVHAEFSGVYGYFQRAYFSDGAVPDPHKVPSFKPTISPTYNIGRSMRSVEKLAREQICENYLVVNLKDNWPKETYGIVCDGIGKALVECHWGSCKLRK